MNPLIPGEIFKQLVSCPFGETPKFAEQNFVVAKDQGVRRVESHRSIRAFGQTWACFIGELTRYCLILLDLLVYYLANSLDNHGGDVGATY